MSRAETMTTHRLLPNATVCVPESQRDSYAKVIGSDRILVHPDSVKGLTPKLNWILDFWGTIFAWRRTPPAIAGTPPRHLRAWQGADALVFVDDDILSLQRCFTQPGEPATIRDPELIETIITNTARLARDVGAYYFGWEASNGALRYFTGLKPFMLTLAAAKKSRKVDHALIVMYEGTRDNREIPDFALDRHTSRGRARKRAWKHFWEEGARLENRAVLEDIYEAPAQKIRQDRQIEMEF